MPPHRPRHTIGQSGLAWLTTDDGSRTLWHQEHDETFHSGCGAVAESLVVYLINSGVAQRLRMRHATTILEVGLGTGTDFLLTAAAAEHFQVPVRYVALENRLLSAEVLVALHEQQLVRSAEAYCANHLIELQGVFDTAEALLPRLIDALEASGEKPSPGFRIGEFVSLELVVGDAALFVGSSPTHAGRFDAVYFDPFSPASSSSLWTDAVFRQMYAALTHTGTLTTYCVQGNVRRRLAGAGFSISKLPGPVGGKREVLLAKK